MNTYRYINIYLCEHFGEHFVNTLVNTFSKVMDTMDTLSFKRPFSFKIRGLSKLYNIALRGVRKLKVFIVFIFFIRSVHQVFIKPFIFLSKVFIFSRWRYNL